MATTWEPMDLNDNHFKGISLKDLKHMLGPKNQDGAFANLFKNNQNSQSVSHALYRSSKEPELTQGISPIPPSFYSLTQWPECIRGTQDQGVCGSCYAFAAVGMLANRFCIASNGAISLALSFEDAIRCDMANYGCNGGWMTNTIQYLINYGVVSYQCLPYDPNSDVTKYCKYRCQSPDKSYRKYKCKKGSAKFLTSTEEIQRELMTNGPVMGSFAVYEDFMNYRGGIYKYTTGKYVVNHATQIHGWGIDSTTGRLYWRCQNQWRTLWGENFGFFRIFDKEVGFGETAWACDADV